MFTCFTYQVIIQMAKLIQMSHNRQFSVKNIHFSKNLSP
jgi:hypothetical protein